MKNILRWIVNTNDPSQNFDQSIYKIDWSRAMPFFLVNLGCIFAFYVGYSFTAILTAIILYFIRLFAIGAFYHRYFSHKTFKTNRFWQLIFAMIAGMAAQRGPLWWAAHHRQHHLVSDQPQDMHSPVQHGFWWSHIGWFLSKQNYHYNGERVKDWARYPELLFLEKYDILMPMLLFVSLLIVGLILQIYFPSLKTTAGQMLVWGFNISTVLLFNSTVLINSLCHVIGTKRYATDDSSRNNFLLALLTLGEGWHNNHHHYPASARQGFKWWEIDITYYLIKLLEVMGIVSDVKGVPKSVLNKNLVSRHDDKKTYKRISTCSD